MKWFRHILILALMSLILFAGFNLLSIGFTYRAIDALAADVRDSFVSDAQLHGNLRQIDWEGLIARNADVVGWIYMPGTSIDYPILAGENNDTYLHTDIDGNHSKAGSIFLEENNHSHFRDFNTIIYGHNMISGVKFSDIDDIARQNITDVNYVYLYLPNGQVKIYRVVSAQITDIFSEIYHLPVTDLAHFYSLMMVGNRFETPSDLLEKINQEDYTRVLTLSTCAEAGASPVRSVVFAMLVQELTID